MCHLCLLEISHNTEANYSLISVHAEQSQSHYSGLLVQPKIWLKSLYDFFKMKMYYLLQLLKYM